MTEKELRAKIDEYIAGLGAEELEAKIAPVDCAKKPQHPDCQPTTKYGGPTPKYGGPLPAYGGPTTRYGGP